MSKPKKKTYSAETITLPDLQPAQPARARSGRRPAAPRANQNRPAETGRDNPLSGEEIIHRLIEYFNKNE